MRVATCRDEQMQSCRTDRVRRRRDRPGRQARVEEAELGRLTGRAVAGAATSDGAIGAEELRKATEVRFQHLEHPRRVERSGGMEDREEHTLFPPRTTSCGDAVDTGDPVGLAGQELGREVAERRDHLRADQLDLLEEVRLAGLDLAGERVAVSRRTAFQGFAT